MTRSSPVTALAAIGVLALALLLPAGAVAQDGATGFFAWLPFPINWGAAEKGSSIDPNGAQAEGSEACESEGGSCIDPDGAQAEGSEPGDSEKGSFIDPNG